MTVSSGVYTASTNVTEIDGSFAHTAGTFTNSSSTVMFTGTTASLTINTSAGTTFQDVIINDGLVAYWPLDEISSPSKDYSGYGHNASWVGTPVSITSVSSTIHFADPGAVSLNGSSDYLDVSNDEDLSFGSGTQDFSVFAWVKRDTTGSLDIIVDNRDGTNDGWFLIYRADDLVSCRKLHPL